MMMNWLAGFRLDIVKSGSSQLLSLLLESRVQLDHINLLLNATIDITVDNMCVLIGFCFGTKKPMFLIFNIWTPQ